jgi:acetyl esterase/lipase
MLAVLLLAATARPIAVGATGALLLPAIFDDAPARPLAWLARPPRREVLQFAYGQGEVNGDLYVPRAAGRHGALVLLLGARPPPRDHPLLVRFAEDLSRAGVVVMIPVSSRLNAGQILPEEVDAIVQAVDLLRGRDDVDPARIGLVGFSVGGGLAVVAAADPRLEGRLAFVTSFGGYFDADDLLRAVATRRLSYAGADEHWVPHPLTIWVVARQLVDALPDTRDRALLDELLMRQDWPTGEYEGLLSPTGRAVLDLLNGPPSADPERVLALLPAANLQRLRQISPALVVDRLRTPLFVMHDLDDRFIPYTESRRLVGRAPPGTVQLHTELELFAHVVPDRALDSPARLLELVKLHRQLYRILLYIL